MARAHQLIELHIYARDLSFGELEIFDICFILYRDFTMTLGQVKLSFGEIVIPEL